MPSEAVIFGYLIAGLILIGIPLRGIILCGGALRRRTSNRRCTLAMIVVLVGWVVTMTVGALMQAGLIKPRVTLIMVGVVALITVAGWVLAVIGLVQCVSRPDRYAGGYKRAILALVIGGIIFGIFGFNIYSAAEEKKALLAPVTPVPDKHSAPVKTGTPPPPDSPQLAATANTIENEAYHFRLQPPPSWNPISPDAFGPTARAAAARHTPEMSTMVLAESYPTTSRMTPQGAMDHIKEGMQDRGLTEFLDEHEFNSHGMSGWWMEARSHTATGVFYYVNWLTLNKGTLYRIVTWAKPTEVDQLRAESQKLVAGLHLIDPNIVTIKREDLAPTNFVSARFGYTINLRDTRWLRRFRDLAASVPAAEFGVTNPRGTASFVMVPVWIGDDNIDLDSLIRALAPQVGVPYPDEAIYGEKDWSQGTLRGRAFAYDGQRAGTDFAYRLRVLRGHGFAYLLGTWMIKNSASQTDQLDLAMDRVTFAEPVAPNPQLANDRERETHMLVYNAIGLSLDRAGQSEASKPWFKRAFEITHRNPAPLINYVQSCFKTSQPAEALAVLNEELPHFSGNQRLASYRAFAQLQTGDVDGAIKSYAELFDEGWRNDTEFAGYIRELCNRNRAEDALAALDRYSSGRENAALSRLRAEIFIAQHELPKAIETLTALQEKDSHDQETALALIDTYLCARRLTEALAECDRLISEQHESVEVLGRKGLAEFALKHYREAKTTLEKALVKALVKTPTNPEIEWLLEGLSDLPREGSGTTVKTPIEPVKIPAALVQP